MQMQNLHKYSILNMYEVHGFQPVYAIYQWRNEMFRRENRRKNG